MSTPEVIDRPDADDQARRIASTVSVLMVRRVVVTLAAAAATAVLARRLQIDVYGTYSAAIATFFVLQAASDLGFSSVLGRELATHPDERAGLLRSTVRAATMWSTGLAVGLIGLALAAGIGSTRGDCLLALVPALALTGASTARQLYLVTYDARRMALVDTACNLGQSFALIGLCWLGASAPVLAIVFGAAGLIDTLIILAMAYSTATGRAGSWGESAAIVRMALPIGIASVMASAYFSVDLVIAGYVIDAEQVAQYAVAVKLLALVTVLPSLLMSVALPALSTANDAESGDVLRLAARLCQWLWITMGPVCVLIFCFAPFCILACFGSAYRDAVPCLRILMLAGVVALLSNVLGTIMVSRRRGAAMFAQNGIALVGNVGLNLWLLPRVGIIAAAWTTVATEVFVCGCAWYSLRRVIRARQLFAGCGRPVVALLAIGGVAMLPMSRLLALIVAILVFPVVMTALRAWPPELTARRRRAVGMTA